MKRSSLASAKVTGKTAECKYTGHQPVRKKKRYERCSHCGARIEYDKHLKAWIAQQHTK